MCWHIAGCRRPPVKHHIVGSGCVAMRIYCHGWGHASHEYYNSSLNRIRTIPTREPNSDIFLSNASTQHDNTFTEIMFIPNVNRLTTLWATYSTCPWYLLCRAWSSCCPCPCHMGVDALCPCPCLHGVRPDAHQPLHPPPHRLPRRPPHQRQEGHRLWRASPRPSLR